MNARLNSIAQRHKSEQGFTLIEVLIAMSLLGIMVVLLFASLRTCAQSWEKGEAKIAAVNEVAVVYQFFKRHLATALPLNNDFNPEKIRFSFQGEPELLSFVSPFPASAAKAGLQMFSLRVVEDDQSRYLQASLSPFVQSPQNVEQPKEEVTLIDHVQKISLAYFGSDPFSEQPSWQNDWFDRENLPRLVKIKIELEDGTQWPEMIIDMKITSSLNDTALEMQDQEVTSENQE